MPDVMYLHSKTLCYFMLIFVDVSAVGLYNTMDNVWIQTTEAEIKIHNCGQNAEYDDSAFHTYGRGAPTQKGHFAPNIHSNDNDSVASESNDFEEELRVPSISIHEVELIGERSKEYGACSNVVAIDNKTKSMEWNTNHFSALLLLGTTFLKSSIPSQSFNMRFQIGVFSFLCLYFKSANSQSSFAPVTKPPYKATAISAGFSVTGSFHLTESTQSDSFIHVLATPNTTETTPSLNFTNKPEVNGGLGFTEGSDNIASNDINNTACTWTFLIGLLSSHASL